MRARILGTVILLLSICPPLACRVFPSGLAERYVRALEGKSPLHGRRARVAVFIYDLTKKRIVYRRNPDMALAPASNMKLVTTACALDILGKEYMFETGAFALGRVMGKALEGDLLVKAGGDPGWAEICVKGGIDHVAASLVKALGREGIYAVKGALVVDASLFDGRFFNPDWPLNQRHAPYCAPVGALTAEEACITILAGGGRQGGKPSMRILPWGSGFRIIDRARVSPKGRSLYFLWKGKGIIEASGCVRPGRTLKFRFAVDDPVRYAGSLLFHRLEKAGIRISKGFNVSKGHVDLEKARCIWRYRTPLLEILKIVNKHSHNLMAEHVFKLLGGGSFEGGRARVTSWLEGLGLPCKGISIRDGSGLSRKNRLTSRVIVGVLTRMWRSGCRKAFVSTLAVPGEEGTLRNRFRQSSMKACVRAKTGWIRGASSLSGYVLHEKAKCAFSILINYPRDVAGFNKYCKRLQERIVELLGYYLGEKQP